MTAAVVTTGYFIFLPWRTWRCSSFYRGVFPQRGRLYALWCTWHQFQSFARIFSERLELRREGRFTYTSAGFHHLEEAAKEGRGGVLVMSHTGNWEVAARLFRRQALRIMLLMGIKPKEAVEGRQKDDLRQEDVAVVGVQQGSGAGWEMLDALRFLRSGGFVSMTGDMVWNEKRTVSVPLFGAETLLPDAPYLLAALAKCPLYVFFSFRTGPRTYHIRITPPIWLNETPRSKRPQAIRKAAAEYAVLLQEAVQQNPFQWYHFEPLPRAGEGHTKSEDTHQ